MLIYLLRMFGDKHLACTGDLPEFRRAEIILRRKAFRARLYEGLHLHEDQNALGVSDNDIQFSMSFPMVTK